jgi:acyl-CoA dehydrogenase
MDFELPEHIAILRDSTRKFVKRELEPIWRQVEEKDRIPEEIWDKLRSLGYFGLTIPEEYGGTEVGTLAYCVVTIELAKTNAAYNSVLSTHNGIGSTAIVSQGSEEQRGKYLPRMATGEWIGAFALTEPNAGCDATGIQTTAKRDGDGFLLNGMKHFITNGPIANVLTVIAYTDKAQGYKGMSAFIIEKGMPGFRLGRTHVTMGGRGSHQAELVFEDCRVPTGALLGPEGRGFITAMRTLDEGRLVLSATCVGNAEYVRDLCVEHARQRVQFGRPIGANQAIQWMLADMDTEIYATKMMLYHAATLYEDGQRVNRQAANVKLFASEMLCRAADSAVQIFGGMGWMRETAVERVFRDSRINRIVEGTSEIMRMVIARDLLGRLED